MSARGGSRAEAFPGGHIGPPLRGYRKRSGTNGNCPETMPCPAGRDGARPLQGAEQACGGGVWSPRPTEARQVVRRNGTPRSSCPTGAMQVVPSIQADVGIGPYGEKSKPHQPPRPAAHSGAFAPAAARDGRESTQGPSPKGATPAATGAALSEAESAERAAGQIRSLPDDLGVQHGVQRSEVSARPRPCSRRGCVH